MLFQFVQCIFNARIDDYCWIILDLKTKLNQCIRKIILYVVRYYIFRVVPDHWISFCRLISRFYTNWKKIPIRRVLFCWIFVLPNPVSLIYFFRFIHVYTLSKKVYPFADYLHECTNRVLKYKFSYENHGLEPKIY